MPGSGFLMMKSQNLVEEKELLDLSISIVNWNTKDILRNCLMSIYKSTHKISYEIFVVDNASSDGSPEMVEKRFPQVKLIRNKENLGFARANNQAIKLSNGRYILLLNSDTIVLDGALDKMVEFMNDRPDAGAAGCRLLNPDGSLQKSIRNFPSLINAYWTNSLLRRLFPKAQITELVTSPKLYLTIREVDSVMGAFLILRSTVVELAGSLDEEFFMYREEIDLCYRIRKTGWKVYFCPLAEIIHLGGASSERVKSESIIRMARSNYRFYKKHYGSAGLILVRLFETTCSGRRLLIWCLAFLFFLARRSEISEKIREIATCFRVNVCPIKRYHPRTRKSGNYENSQL